MRAHKKGWVEVDRQRRDTDRRSRPTRFDDWRKTKLLAKSGPLMQLACTKAGALRNWFAFAHNILPTRNEHRHLVPFDACNEDGDGFVAHVTPLEAAKYLSQGLCCVVVGRKAVLHCRPIGLIFDCQYDFPVPIRHSC